MQWIKWLLVGSSLAGLGCGSSGPRTYPVTGRIEVASGDVSALAGSYVEAKLVNDAHLRASGEIQPDGTFQLQTQQGGSIQTGAQEGSYQVRLILGDDDAALRRKAKALVGDRFLKFPSSGWTLQVPAESEVILRVTPR